VPDFQISSTSGRKFAPFAVAVAVVMIDREDRVLLLGSHKRNMWTWEVPSGSVEAGETILEAVARELQEELGQDVRWKPLGTVHAYTIRYDDAVDRMVSIVYLVSYEGGELAPGDDMTGAEVRWVSPSELGSVAVAVPSASWALARAVDLFRVWRRGDVPDLQPLLDS
jgi:8-oxo-dGTP diphosphatase